MDMFIVPLCSIGVFRYLVAPAVRHLLEAGLHTQVTAAPVEWLLSSFELLYNALWLFPAYVISLIVNTLWCVSLHFISCMTSVSISDLFSPGKVVLCPAHPRTVPCRRTHI